MGRQLRTVALILFMASASFTPRQCLAAHRLATHHFWSARPVAHPSAHYRQPYTTYYGFPHKNYGWGWHGDRYRGQVHSHRGYYGDVWEWGHRLRL